MALHITNPEVEQEVRQLASARGQSITELIGTAVTELKVRESGPRKAKPTVAEIKAVIRSEPLLFKGNDFSQTDVILA